MSGSYEGFLGDSFDYSSQTFNAEKAKQEAEEKKRNSTLYYLVRLALEKAH